MAAAPPGRPAASPRAPLQVLAAALVLWGSAEAELQGPAASYDTGAKKFMAGDDLTDQRKECSTCVVSEAIPSLLQPDPPLPTGKELDNTWVTEAHVFWFAPVEVVPLTTDVGGPEPVVFNQALASEVLKTFEEFRKTHEAHGWYQTVSKEAGRSEGEIANDAFHNYQKRLFTCGGNMTAMNEDKPCLRHHDDPTTWDSLEKLPAYARLRKIVFALTRRYLERAGMSKAVAQGLNISAFSWANVHGDGEYRPPANSPGSYCTAVFYAQAGPRAGQFRLKDPRGSSAPFARHFVRKPRAGQLFIFPGWLNHMTLPSSSRFPAKEAGAQENKGVVTYVFTIGPSDHVGFTSKRWWSDPTADLRFGRHILTPRESLDFNIGPKEWAWRTGGWSGGVQHVIDF